MASIPISFNSFLLPIIKARRYLVQMTKRKSADEFPQELLTEFDRYVHGELAWTRTVKFFKKNLS